MMSGLQKLAFLLFITLTIVKVSVAVNSENIYNPTSPTRFLRDNCACADHLNCQCCVKVGFLREQNLCANWTISASDLEIRTIVNLNRAKLLEKTFLGLNIPPFCVPLLAPVPLSACIQIHSLTLHKHRTLQVCANAALRFLKFNFIDILLGCVDIGRKGIKVVRPNDKREVTSLIEVTTDSSEKVFSNKVTEILLETSEGIDEKLEALKTKVNDQFSPTRILSSKLKF